MIQHDHILRFNKLSSYSNLIHGFSTRFFGSLRPSHAQYQDSLKKFTQALSITPQQLVRMNQVHSSTVSFVSEKDRGETIAKTDGLITQDIKVFLGVISADCIPLLLYDPEKQFVAVVHAGWRGLFSEIIKEAISQLIAKGSKPDDIIVGIGPCIGVCCYNIPADRAQMYLEKFPDWESFIVKRDGTLFFDLSAVAKQQLTSLGIRRSNIEEAHYCTFDHEDVYSYRREGENFGEMMGVIGLRP
jgi:polyphenol oxidase